MREALAFGTTDPVDRPGTRSCMGSWMAIP